MERYKETLKVDIDNIHKKSVKEMQYRIAYKEFVEEQRNQFLLFINYLNKYINELKEEGVISPFLEFRARIKATNSALKNHDKKALDDIFGVEFICATDQEILILKQKLEELLEIRKERIHNKDNGYKAIHDVYSMKKSFIDDLNYTNNKSKCTEEEQQRFPVVEIQYKTIEVFYQANFGTASHEKYKQVEIPILQNLYDANKIEIGEHIPRMWTSDSNSDNTRELSIEEILKKMYPSLKMTNRKIKIEDKDTTKEYIV